MSDKPQLVKRFGTIPELCHALLAGHWSAAVPLSDALAEAGRPDEVRMLAWMLFDRGEGRMGASFAADLSRHFAADMWTIESLAIVAAAGSNPWREIERDTLPSAAAAWRTSSGLWMPVEAADDPDQRERDARACEAVAASYRETMAAHHTPWLEDWAIGAIACATRIRNQPRPDPAEDTTT